jgi:hypothetical protein
VAGTLDRAYADSLQAQSLLFPLRSESRARALLRFCAAYFWPDLPRLRYLYGDRSRAFLLLRWMLLPFRAMRRAATVGGAYVAFRAGRVWPGLRGSAPRP